MNSETLTKSVQPQKEVVLSRLLNEELTQARLRNPSFSLRAFARKLQLSPSALSEILNGKRKVSKAIAIRIADRLLLDPEKRTELLHAFDEALALNRPHDSSLTSDVAGEGTSQIFQLTMDHFRSISEWYHFGILSLAETGDFQSDPEWVARRLGISKSTAQQAIERLLRLEMLERDPEGQLKPSGMNYRTPDEIADLSLRKSHAANLELARASLENDPVPARDFTAITMAIDPERIPEAKKRIRAFRDDLCAYLSGGKKAEVYKFCMQLIPLTKLEEK